MMRLYGRDHYKGVPESDLPDAIIEVHGDENRWMMAYRDQGFSMEIHYCPWCGAHLSPTHRPRPPLEPAADEEPVHDETEFELWCQREADADLKAPQYLRSNTTTHRNKAGHLICRISFTKMDGGEAVFIAERALNGDCSLYIQLA
jgi:hypothetical protein